MKDLIKKLKEIRENYQNHSALREEGFEIGINEAIKQINLNIPIVSNFLNAEGAPTFKDWLDKYFEPMIINETYKKKINGIEHTKAFLYKKYCKAYNSDF